jgi:hypothetical protein
MNNAAVAAATTAQALRDWLLDGPAQMHTGPEAGAVAGTIELSGTAHYVYGEITGYYLHWLATGAVDAANASRKARSALAWVVRRYAGDELPPTRIHLVEAPDDWRNHVQFCFDLAMLVGGLAKAEARGLIEAPAALWLRLGTALAQFADGTRITALPLGERTPLPRRWSTSNGPFLAKAASRILLAPARAMLPTRVLQSAKATLEAVGVSATEAQIDMLHPSLYAIEGMICSDATPAIIAARCLERVLAFDPGDGQLPEAPDSAVPRSDVIAQALRLAVWLRAHAVDGAPSDRAIETLVKALIARVRGDGSIAFRPDSAEPQINSWCAMFAQQALDWYSRWRATGALVGISASDLV